MGKSLGIDCRSRAEVAPPAELDALTRAGRHVVLRFATLSEGDTRALIDRLATALPDHSVYDSGGGRDHVQITVMPVVARSRVLEHRGHVLRAIGEYRRACAELVARYQAGTLEREWEADEHGEHCRFANRRTGQVVEAPLLERVDAGRVDPYFLALFVRSTAGLEPVVELLAHDFHDAARILDIVGDGGALDAEPAAAPDRVELSRSRAAWVVPRLARSFVRRRRREVMMKIVGYILAALGGLMILGTLNMGMTQYDLSSQHDQSKFIGGLGISALILVAGLALSRKATR